MFHKRRGFKKRGFKRHGKFQKRHGKRFSSYRVSRGGIRL